MLLLRTALRALVALAIALTATAGAASAQVRPAAGEATTPQLIDRSVARGEISRDTGRLYRTYALVAPDRVPPRLRGERPYDATLELLALRREANRMAPGPRRREVSTLLDPQQSALQSELPPRYCDVLSTSPLPNEVQSEHFYVEYNEVLLGGGLTIDDYVDSLESAWNTEAGAFSWPAPPVLQSNPAPGGKYHVRIDALGPVVYGFVSSVGTHAGPVGDNPSTQWDDADADASCMGLNQDYSEFPGGPRRALDATTAHEFHHSLQFGIGAVTGANAPEPHFVEGTATWMEDEVHDGADDNRGYLYPQFDDGMGEHAGDEYAYWLTWRGLTERFGANRAGGAEQVFQEFYEAISRNEGLALDVLDARLTARGTSLPQAFHDYAVAARLVQPCGSALALPFCFEEAAGYRAAAGVPADHAAIDGAPGARDGEVEDAYAIQWTALPPAGAPYAVTVQHTGTGGAVQATVACSTTLGGQVRAALPALLAGEVASATGFDPSACATRPVAVVTSASRESGDPGEPPARPFRVSASQEPATRRLTVARDGGGAGTVTSAPAGIDCGAGCQADFVAGGTVTLTAAPAAGSDFAGWGDGCAGTGACTLSLTRDRRVTATFRPTPDTSAPRLRVTSRKVRVTRRGRARLRLGCEDEPSGSCRGRLVLRARSAPGERTARIGRRRVARMDHGESRTVKLRLNRRGRRLLRRSPRGRLRAVARTVAFDDAGNRGVERVRVHVVRRR